MKILMLAYPGMTPLDLMGPLQVWSQWEGTEIQLVWKTKTLITTDTVMGFMPTHDFDDCFTQPDIVFVPGGSKATLELMSDTATLDFLRTKAADAQWVCSVCTGSLVLAAAGLLEGYQATSHWAALEVLAGMGVDVVRQRYVFDRNRASGGGVTAGIDFGLALVAQIGSDEEAQSIQLSLEYAPAPPFNSGSPETASANIVEMATARLNSAMV